MNTILENIYNYSPVIFQNIFCTIYGYKEKKKRYGGDFYKLLSWLEESQWAKETQIMEYQNEHLKKIITYAYENVPYYKELFDLAKLKPSDIKTVDDLNYIPITRKEDLRSNSSKFISRKYSAANLIKMHTSGTSGKALELYHTLEQIRFQWAIWWRHRKRFGVNVADPHATFTGKVVVPLSQSRPPFWRENYAAKQTLFNMQHITRKNIKHIIDRLNKTEFIYYSGYPSIIYSLCRFMELEGYELTNKPKYVFTGAEKLYDYQKETISKVLGCIVTDQYGFSEGCGNASKCEQEVYHEDYEFGILEVLHDDKNKEVLHDDKNKTEIQSGIVVATGFADYGMPLIRYEVGDTAVCSNKKCQCGRHSKVILDIEGRVEDFVVTPEGTHIKRFDYLFKDTTNVIEAQILQKQLGSITIRIVKNDFYSTKDETYLLQQVRKYISKNIEVNFEYLSEIPRESSGKFKAVKSLLK